MAYKKKNNHEIMREIAPFMNLGLQMVLPVLLGLWFGYWLDGKYGFTPWCMLIFGLLGIAVSIKSLLDVIKKLKK